VSQSRPGGRLRAYLGFLAAILWYFLARALAARAAAGLVRDPWVPLAEQFALVFLLLAGFVFFGRVLDRQTEPLAEQGLPLRDGWQAELGLGLAAGWGLAAVCVLPMALIGGIAIVLTPGLASWGWLLAEAVFFALAALAEELLLRGYGFQSFQRALGALPAALGMAVFYAILQSVTPGSSRASLAVSMVFSLLLTVVYLRTRALWVSWAVNFAWKASRALVFGLAIAGVNSHSPVVQGNPMGPFWLTGGGFGLDGSWFAFVVMLAAVPVAVRLTRELDFRWNAPVLIPGGIAVDIDAEARRQHEAAMSPAAPAAPVLLQIQPAAPQPLPPEPSANSIPQVSAQPNSER
jgi:hypothetical protein